MEKTSVSTRSFGKTLKNILPVLNWLPVYQASFLKWDVIAGITLASFVLPESMAYATLAGVPPEAGIYCCLAGGLVFALLTNSRQMAVGPTSAISLMVGTTVALLSGGDLQRWVAIASLTALIVTVLCFAAYMLKLSVVINFIGENVLLGFKTGAAFVIAATQLPKLFGVEGGAGNFFYRIQHLFQQAPEMNMSVFFFGIIALGLLIAGNHLFPGRPIPIIVVISAILIFSFTSLSQYGFHLTGELPKGLPAVGRPMIHYHDVEGILGLALGCFLMGYIETMAVARTFAEKNNYKIQPRQELLSMGAANFASAMTGGYVVSGGLSQSTVNDKAGAKTPLALVFCSVILAVLLLFFTGLLKNLPEVILAVLVLDAMTGLVKIKELKRLYFLSKPEFIIAAVAFTGVLFFGILKGVLIASFLSILIIIKRAAYPPVTELGRIPGTAIYTNLKRHPSNETIEGCIILRIDSSIFYFNESSISNQLNDQLDNANREIRRAIIDLSSSPVMDVAGSKMIMNFARETARRNIKLKIVDAHGEVRELLRKQGLEEITGPLSRKISLHESVVESGLA